MSVIEEFKYETLGSLRTRVFETRTATGSELFSLLALSSHNRISLPSFFSPLDMISTKIWETPLPWLAKCSFPVAVRVSKVRVLKLPNLGRRRKPEVNNSHTRVSQIFLHLIVSNSEKITLCQHKLKRKAALFRSPSGGRKRLILKGFRAVGFLLERPDFD